MAWNSTLGRGEKSKEWDRVRAKLKKRFEAAVVTRCEICWSAFALGFAHRKKRRNITTEAELEICALLCCDDHARLEMLPESEMGERIDGIIAARETAV